MKNFNLIIFLFILISAVLSISSCKPDSEKPEAKAKPYCYIENGIEVCYETAK